MNFDVSFALKSFLPILRAVPITLFIAIVSTVVGLLLGGGIAFSRIYKVPGLNGLAKIYVSFIRSVPMIVMLYVVYYSLPSMISALSVRYGLGISMKNVPSMAYAIVTFSFYMGGYSSEMIRAAIVSVDAKQMEAAYSVGLTKAQGLRRIIVPQALVVAMPNFGNSFLGTLKGVSLASFVGVQELMNTARVEAAIGLNFIETYTITAIIYWVICVLFERFFTLIEGKLRFGNKPGSAI
jgi:L-cystine transport system permease protein